MKRRLAIAFALALATAVCLWAWWARDLRHYPRVFNGPMVHRVTPEAFTLTWEIDPDIEAYVAVLNAEGAEIGSVPAARIKNPVTPATNLQTLTSDRLEAGPTRALGSTLSRSRWSATVHGLQSGHSYRYRITAKSPAGHSTVVSEHPVRTTVRPGLPFRFAVVGDTGTGQSAQYRVARQLSTWTPDFVLHAGDLITPQADRKDLPAKFFRPYADLLASVPMYPCLGNHDYRVEQGQPILDTFILPANSPPGEQPGRHYWFDWGDARFIFVDSNDDFPHFRDLVAPWLDGALADAGDRWTIVVWHEPVYTHGDKYPPAQKLLLSLVPVLDKHRCTLVFSGHQHLYERSRPIRAGQVVPLDTPRIPARRDSIASGDLPQAGGASRVPPGEGTVYIVTGTGGSNLYSELTPESPLIASFCDTQYGFTVVDVTPDRLAVRQIAAAGDVLDEYAIEKPGK